MKYKMLALILTLTVASWAQAASQPTLSTPQQSTVPTNKAKCACCDKMAATDTKDAAACCTHHDMNAKDSKETTSCCAGKSAMSGAKGAMSCMRTGKTNAAASCCNESCSKDSCAKDKTASACCSSSCDKDGKACCAGNKAEKTAKSCCKKYELHS